MSKETEILITHWVSNIILALVWAYFANAQFEAFRATNSIVYLLFAALEGLTAALFIFREIPFEHSMRLSHWVFGLAGTFTPLLLRPTVDFNGFHGATLIVTVLGAVLFIVSLLSLNRSFGIIAAKRTLRTRGMYGFVRHPMYLSHLILLAGYIAANPSVQNAVLYLLIAFFHITRVRYEESLWSNEQSYVEYTKKVHWKLFPGIF